ncbi:MULTISPECIES: SRPBCC family protein [Bacillaceae]|uniref:SRPBCC family protein n=1 Tax=Bacillaceae TaxID=186817 RepID=UPI000BFD3085|nr:MULTISPECIES: SRPBCC family protein [Bacillaceae]MCM3162471.1 SRPBCC family protein [Metabacillus litoralis]PGT90549.1 cell division protein [Bacillus sp. AFS040349]UGB30867.1 SRPBCC family protein [Metabacillus sp. B2-18]
MPIIKTDMFIYAPRDICFDVARDIDIHTQSTSQTNERAIGGVTSGLIELNETVTWEAVHFGIKQNLTVRITEFDFPNRFVDEMEKGAFKRFYHVHEFIEKPNGTLMLDTFDYTSPFGFIGKIADRLFLEQYMREFLITRNRYIKKVAEERVG